MPELFFPAYRNYLSARQNADNAMMALLAGAHLADHTLKLTTGSNRLMSEIFPVVPHIRRFDLTTEAAQRLLRDADAHLAAVAVPYALAVHEDFGMTSIDILRTEGISVLDRKKQVRAWNMHEVFFDSAGAPRPTVALEHFHLLREMRNSQIHEGGTASARLASHLASFSPQAAQEWRRVYGRDATATVVNGRVNFDSSDIFASFAVTKRLGREMNSALQSCLSRATWARFGAEDYSRLSPNKARNSDPWLRSLRGHFAQHFAVLAMSDDEITQGARAAGLWTRATDHIPPRRRDNPRHRKN